MSDGNPDGHTVQCFFYGTLMHPKILERVTGSNRHRYIPAVLKDHFCSKLKNLDYPGTVRRTGATTAGMLVQGITNDELKRLDLFEGDEYIAQTVEVTAIETGTRYTCLTYIFQDQTVLEHTTWDFETFKAEKVHRWTNDSAQHEYSMLPEQSIPIDGTGGRGTFQSFADSE